MKKYFLLFCVICLLLSAAAVYADENSVIEDTAGNIFFSAETIDRADRDLAWFGDILNLSGTVVGKNLIGLGEYMTLSGTAIGSDAFMIAKDLNINDSVVDSNIIAGAQSFSMNSGSSAKAIYAAAMTVKIDGEADALFLCGDDVTVNGVVHGDAHIYAKNVVVGANAVIEGKLSVRSTSDPSIDADAKIRVYSFRKQEIIDENFEVQPAVDGDEVKNTAAPAEIEVPVQVPAAPKENLLQNLLKSVITCVLMALVICWLAKDSIEPCNLKLGIHVIADFFLGVLLLLLLPLLSLICIISGYAVPLGIVLIAFLFAGCAVSVPFFGAAVMRRCFPGMNRVLAAVIGAAVNGILTALPVVGVILGILAGAWTLGHFTAFAIKGPKDTSGMIEPAFDPNDHLETF